MTKSRSSLRRLTSPLLLAVCGCLTVGCLLLSDRPEFYRCRSQADCIVGEETCDTSNGTVSVGQCMPIGYCTSDAWCPDGPPPQACINERCTPVQCTDYYDDACAQYRCGPSNACSTVCAADGDCQDFESHSYYCLAGVCVVDPCNTGLCGAYDCTNHVCNTSCVYPVEGCASGHICSGSVCQPW